MKAYEIPGDLDCPVCWRQLGVCVAEVNDQGRGPRPNDQTICAHCLSYLRYVELGEGQLGLEWIDRDQFEGLPERNQAALMQVRGVILQRQKEAQDRALKGQDTN